MHTDILIDLTIIDILTSIIATTAASIGAILSSVAVLVLTEDIVLMDTAVLAVLA